MYVFGECLEDEERAVTHADKGAPSGGVMSEGKTT